MDYEDARALDTSRVTWEMNARPLSDWIDLGSSNISKIFMRWKHATSAVSAIVRKASTHPEKVSTRVRSYLCFFVRRHMCEICLPVFPRMTTSKLVSIKGRGVHKAPSGEVWVWVQGMGCPCVIALGR